ncbi:MAG TPA: hypothetical protein VKM54_19760 [Myxococcota bacterium]|nr:hypothetical protein [Myxococcota bacterium]
MNALVPNVTEIERAIRVLHPKKGTIFELWGADATIWSVSNIPVVRGIFDSPDAAIGIAKLLHDRNAKATYVGLNALSPEGAKRYLGANGKMNECAIRKTRKVRSTVESLILPTIWDGHRRKLFARPRELLSDASQY